MHKIQLTTEEVGLTLRALEELRQRPEVSRQESDGIVNLVDYIETECGVKRRGVATQPTEREPTMEDREAQAAYDDFWEL